MTYGNTERTNTINQLLVEMDGMHSGNDNIIVIFATNDPDSIDPALLRPGRIDRTIEISHPDYDDRKELLKLTTQDISLNPNVNLDKLARGLIGFSRAEIVALVNEAKFFAMREQGYGVSMTNLEKAKDKVILGMQKDINKIREEDLKCTAYHEAGHAYMTYYHRKHLDPIYKATIVPHGHSLGVVISEPRYDKVSRTKAFMEGRMQVLFAGRICEEIFIGLDYVTSGCSSDIQKARQSAEYYVRYGMKSSYGLKYYNDYKNSSSNYEKDLIYREVAELMEEMEKEARFILQRDRDQVEKLAKALLVAETLTGEEIEKIFLGHKSPLIPYINKKIISLV